MTASRGIENWWHDLLPGFPGNPSFPEVEREYITVYPTKLDSIAAHDIWRPRPICCYIHIPFCDRICSFCGFLKSSYSRERVERYMAALYREIELYSVMPYVRESRISVLYIGGGTPSVLPIEDLSALISRLRDAVAFAEDVEIEVEVHPRHATPAYLRGLKELGIDRVSIGIQSTSRELLESLGAQHTEEESHMALEAAGVCGIEKTGCDLIFNAPGETADQWAQDLNTAVGAGMNSVSCYRLGLIPGTSLFRKAPSLNPVGPEYRMYEYAVDYFTSIGMSQYSLTCFSHPGKESKYVLRAWRAPQLETLAFGAGALTFDFRGHTWVNTHNIDRYIKSLAGGELPILMGKRVTTAEAVSRFMVYGVRAMKISKAEFRDLHGLEIDGIYSAELTQLERDGLIRNTAEYVELTTLGGFYVENICKMFYTPENRSFPQPIGVQLANIQ